MMCDEKLDMLLEQWAHEDIPMPEDFHQRTMIRIQAEARRLRKQKQRKMWGGAVAAVVLLCCIPFAKMQLDRLSIDAGVNNQAQPMVAVEDGAVEPSYSMLEDEMLQLEVQNAAASDAPSEAKLEAGERLSEKENLDANGNAAAFDANSGGEPSENNSAGDVPWNQMAAEDIPMVASLEDFDDNMSVTPYSRNVNEAVPEEDLAITAEQIEDYRKQLSQANADLKALNEQLAQYEKQLSEAPADDMQAKKEEIAQKIKELEEKMKTIEVSINTLEEKQNAHQ